jgi:hypothetical protein
MEEGMDAVRDGIEDEDENEGRGRVGNGRWLNGGRLREDFLGRDVNTMPLHRDWTDDGNFALLWGSRAIVP